MYVASHFTYIRMCDSACTFKACITSKTGTCHALLYAILACVHGSVNTHNAQEMEITSLHLVCHTTFMV